MRVVRQGPGLTRAVATNYYDIESCLPPPPHPPPSPLPLSLSRPPCCPPLPNTPTHTPQAGLVLVPELFTKTLFVVANAVTVDVCQFGVSFLINGFCALPARLKASEADLQGG